MGALTFTAKGYFADDTRTRHAAFSTANFYPGRMEALRPDRALDIRIEHHALDPWATSRVLSGWSLFDRSWPDIRANATDFFLIRMIKQGSAIVWHNGRRSELEAKSLFITGSLTPLRIELIPPERGGWHEELLVAVPATKIHERLEVNRFLNTRIDLSEPHAEAVGQLIEYAHEYGPSLTPTSAERIFMSIVDEIASCFDQDEQSRQPSDITSLWQERIEVFMRQKFSNPALSLDDVARNFNVSRRYISLLLSRNGTTFYKLLNSIRLEEGARLLASHGARQMSIGQISFRVGFKSAAHFTDTFHRAYGSTPSAFRATRLVSRPH